MVIKVIALILAALIVISVGYMIVNSVILLFNGRTVGEAISESWNNLTHLFGLIKEAKAWDTEYPMTNQHISWSH